MDLWDSYEDQQREMQSPAFSGSSPHTSISLGTGRLESRFIVEDLGVLMDMKLNMSQQCILAVKKTNSHLGCIMKSIISRSREVVRHMWNAVSNYGFPSKRDMDILEQV